MSDRRKELGLFLASWTVRLLVAIPVVLAAVPPAFDEDVYLERAAAYARIAKAIASGVAPLTGDFAAAYSFGVWPPLNSLVLAAPMLVFGEHAAVARLALTLISAATTVLLYRLTRQIFSERAAICAALAHAFYPSFVAFAHLLWSETTYIFFLVLAVYWVFRLRRESVPRKRLLLAAGVGVALGACLLTRAAGVPYLLVIPLVVMLRGDGVSRNSGGMRSRYLESLIIAVVAVVLALPWEMSLAARQKKFVALSTANAVNLYLGNNEWNLGADAGRARAKVLAASKRYADEHGIDRDAAAVRLTGEYIARDPAGFLSGLFLKLRLMFLPDQFVLRHFLSVVYPPISSAALGFVWALLAASFMAFAALAAIGFLRSADTVDAHLLRVFVLVGVLPALLTLANTRIALPSLALLCPAIGHALDPKRAGRRAQADAVLALAVAALAVLNAMTADRHPARGIVASAAYSPLVTPLARTLGWNVRYNDAVQLRPTPNAADETFRISLRDSLHAFAGEDPHARSWRPESPRSVLSLSVSSTAGAPPIAIELSAGTAAAPSIVEPLSPPLWRRWTSAHGGELEVRWLGSGKGFEGGGDGE